MHGPSSSSAQSRPHPDASRELWALYYAGRGWPVVPLHSAEKTLCSCSDPICKSAGKHPRTQHGVKDASTDLEQIRRWWKQWPDANVGIATGVVSGLLVLDIDPSKGGDESYQQLQNELPGAFAAPVKVRTGSRGTHLYFECLKATPSRANIRPGIDVKADDSYVVAPSSRDVNGRHYCFVSNSGLACPPVAAALRDLIFKASSQQSEGPTRASRAKARWPARALIARTIRAKPRKANKPTTKQPAKGSRGRANRPRSRARRPRVFSPPRYLGRIL